METHNHDHHHEITKRTDDEEDFFFAMQMANGGAVSCVIKAAVDLEVFDIISNAGPNAYLSASEIVSHLKTRNPDRSVCMLDRILGLLVSQSLLTCSHVILERERVEWRYGLTNASRHLAKRDDGVSLSWLLLLGLQKPGLFLPS